MARAGRQTGTRPVETWNPDHCGEMDMRIAADGSWHYRGSPISRLELVRLFASILRREPDGGYVLVTPVEKLSIKVDDAPFLAVEMHAQGRGPEQLLTFRTNVGDIVLADKDHPLRFAVEPGTGGLKPYVQVRNGLMALATRALQQEMASLAQDDGNGLGLYSGAMFFPFLTPGTDRAS